MLPPDVVRVGPAGGPGPWLDATYLAEHAAEIDVLHLHTGIGPVTERRRAVLERDRAPLGAPAGRDGPSRAGRRVARPAQRRAAEDAHLDAVLGTAEVVLTLTSGAADAIAERFGRTAIVVAHPSVARPDPELGAERGLVGLRLGAGAAAGPGGPGARRAVRGRVRRWPAAGPGGGRGATSPARSASWPQRQELELVVHRADERAAQFQQLHVAVLPEPCGAHSRDLEICRDVGTRVVAPSCGWLPGQWGEVVCYGEDDRGRLDPVSLTGAVAAALTRPMLLPADRGWREEQLAAVRRVHAEVYAQVAGDRGWV